jgi:hypothetical protein
MPNLIGSGANQVPTNGMLGSAAFINKGELPAAILVSYVNTALPSGINGLLAYCTNGRKVGEGVGAGTGVPVYYSNGVWRVFSTDSAVVV